MTTEAKPIGTGTDYEWVECQNVKCKRMHVEIVDKRFHRQKGK